MFALVYVRDEQEVNELIFSLLPLSAERLLSRILSLRVGISESTETPLNNSIIIRL